MSSPQSSEALRTCIYIISSWFYNPWWVTLTNHLFSSIVQCLWSAWIEKLVCRQNDFSIYKQKQMPSYFLSIWRQVFPRWSKRCITAIYIDQMTWMLPSLSIRAVIVEPRSIKSSIRKQAVGTDSWYCGERKYCWTPWGVDSLSETEEEHAPSSVCGLYLTAGYWAPFMKQYRDR